MSARLRVYSAFAYEKAGGDFGFGKIGVPIAELSLPGTNAEAQRRTTLAAGLTTTLFSYNTFGHFGVLAFRLIGEGYVNVSYLVDRPVSVSNLDPAGTARRWRHFDLSCGIDFRFPTNRALLNPDAAKDIGDTAGDPTLWAQSDNETGYIYQVRVKNPGTAAVEIERSAFN